MFNECIRFKRLYLLTWLIIGFDKNAGYEINFSVTHKGQTYWEMNYAAYKKTLKQNSVGTHCISLNG